MWRLARPMLATRAVATRRMFAITSARFASSAGATTATKPTHAAVPSDAKTKEAPPLPMLTIADVLVQREAALSQREESATKSFDEWESIPGSHTIQQAVNLMVEHSIGALIVTEEKQGVVGIVTERDVLKKMSPRTIASELLRPVNEIMSKQIVCTPPTVNVLDALATMSKENIRHLAVVKAEMADAVKKGTVPEQAMRSVISMRTILKSYAEYLNLQEDEEEPEAATANEAPTLEVETKTPEVPADGKAGETQTEKKPDATKEVAAVEEIVTAHSLLKEKSKKLKLILNTRPEDNVSVADAVEAMARHDFGSVLVVDQDLSLLGIFTERDYLTRVLFAKQDPTQIKVADAASRNLVCMHPEDTLDECLDFAAERRCRHYPVVAPPRNNKDNELVGILSIKNLAHEISKGQTTHSGFHLMDYLKKRSEKKEATPAKKEAAPAKKEAEPKAASPASAAPAARGGACEIPTKAAPAAAHAKTVE